MYAVRKLAHGSGHIACVDIPEPAVTPGHVKIKIAYCGICGSDAHIVGGYESEVAPLPVPFTMGHEFSGTVTEVGEGVTRFRPGDRVTALVTTGYCGKCQSCLTGNIAACTHSKNMGYECDGAMTEYLCTEEAGVFLLPDNISFEEGAQAEPACVAAHAVLEVVDLKPTDTVAIIGAGPIGLLVLQFVKACGAKAILVDISKFSSRLELGKRLGADYTFENDNCNVIQEVKALTAGLGADVVYECAGADSCVTQAVMMTRKRGTIVELAITSPSGTHIQSYLVAVMLGMRIQCSYGHSMATWPKVLKLMEDGRINTRDLVSHKFSFQQIEEALACSDPSKLKVLLHP